MKIAFRFQLILLGSLCTASALQGGAVTFTTGTFNPAHWTSHVLPGSTGTGFGSTENSGGNPDAYRRVSLTVDPFEFVGDAEMWNLAVFNPSVQGQVTGVSMSYDIARVFTSHIHATQVTRGLAVEQNGVIQTHFIGVSTATPPNWEHVSIADVLPLFPGINWVNGSTIRFGIFDMVGTSGTGFTIDAGYDNFQVVVNFNAVPDGGTSAALLASTTLGIAGLSRSRRRVA